jgi:hypothetical protein
LEETAVLQFSALVSAMGWTNEMEFAKVLCSTARPASADDALAVLEPFAVKVAWAVLWGGGGSDAVSLPANVLPVRLAEEQVSNFPDNESNRRSFWWIWLANEPPCAHFSHA